MMAIETQVDAAVRTLARAKLRAMEDALHFFQEGAEVVRRVAAIDDGASSALQHALATTSALEHEISTRTAKAEGEAERKGVVRMPAVADPVAERAEARMAS